MQGCFIANTEYYIISVLSSMPDRRACHKSAVVPVAVLHCSHFSLAAFVNVIYVMRLYRHFHFRHLNIGILSISLFSAVVENISLDKPSVPYFDNWSVGQSVVLASLASMPTNTQYKLN